MRAINRISAGHLSDGDLIIINHILVYVDNKGNGYNTSFSEVCFKREMESYQFNGGSFQFLQPPMEAIFSNKVKEITDVSKQYVSLQYNN